MIYIIIDKGYEVDGYSSPSNLIGLVTTDKEKAIATFNEYFSDLPKDDKWHYEYELLEYTDGFKSTDSIGPKILLSSSND